MSDPGFPPQTFPIQYFRTVDPSKIQDALNALIVDLNTLFRQFGASSVGIVTKKQLRNYLAGQGQLVTVDNVIPADINDAVNIAWESNTMAIGDTLYLFIQSTLGLSNAQMLAAFAVMMGFAP